MTLQRSARYLYLRLIRMRSNPKEIARGLAIGVFVGITPFIGFHMLLAVALAMLLKGNKFMALIGTWVANPLTFSFIFFLDYKVGRWILGDGPKILKLSSTHPLDVLHMSWKILLPMSLGSLLIGLAAAVLAYFLSNPLIAGIKEWREKKMSVLV
ncbi:MAG: DUF2062 domain-containing protein [bacterium]